MRGIKLFTIAAVFILSLGIAGQASAACDADLNGDGTVDAVDYLALIASWGQCPGACPADIDGNGTVDAVDYLALIAGWGSCPSTYQCPAEMPAYYDPAAVHDESSVEWVANGVCNETIAESGSGELVCVQEQTADMLADINWILGNYDFTNAVFDAQSGGLQTYRHSPDVLLCGTGAGLFPEGFFDDLAECWHGDIRPGSALILDFDWNVNYYEAHHAYEAHVQETYPNGFCEINNLIGAPTGFHAEDQGDGWKYWTVRSTETCDFYGCRCDATVTLWSNGTDYFLDQVTNDSIFTMYQGSMCEDPRFNF